jgi:hypothetical protein
MRLFALAAILALGVLAGLSDEKAPGAGKNTPPKPPAPSRPPAPPPRPPVNPAALVIPRLPANFRPGPGARLAPWNVDVTFTFNADVGKVRSLDPPADFDEKGNIQKHTKEELAALKGDTPEEKKMAGYRSDYSELKVGDMVQVALSVHKTNATEEKKGKGDKKEKEEGKADKPDKGDTPAKDGRWVVANQFIGKITKIDGATTISGPKMTVRVTTVQVVQGRNKPAGNRTITVKPEQGQATLILAGRRPPAPPAKP